MKWPFPIASSRWFLPLLLLGGLALVTWKWGRNEGVGSRAVESEPAGAGNGQTSLVGKNPSPTPLPEDSEPEALDEYCSDSTEAGGALLIVKGASFTTAGGDLWFRDGAGEERFVAGKVTGARFSPDGEKIAYSTSQNAVFIETLTGESIAEIPRASEPTWLADGSGINFLAVPSSDYPDLECFAVYDLKSGRLDFQNQN